jgi:cell division protein FtsI (penicillin-binding protein 3)
MAIKGKVGKDNDDNDEEQAPRAMWKFWLVVLLLNFGFLAVILRLFVVQVIDSQKYSSIAKQQHESKVTLRSDRGSIYDRNGKLIAGTIQSISIAIDPLLLKEKEQDKDKLKEKAKEIKKQEDLNKVVEIIEKYTKVPRQQLLQKIYSSSQSFMWLARGLLPEEADELRDIHARWLIKIQEPRRHFLYDKTGSQIIGITNIDNHGVSGIEARYDTVLGGVSGYMIMQRDGKGRLHPSADLPSFPATHGASLQLTIDIDLQRSAEYELEQGILRTGAESGTVIALKPETGEILAIASYPSFNPNNTIDITSTTLRNRAYTDLYEPGSTFKAFIAASAIEEKLLNPMTIVDGHNGEIDLGYFKVKDDHPLGQVPFHVALEQSSNVVFSSVGNSIPDKKFYKYLRDFGFGTTLGLDVYGEQPGKLKKTSEFNQTTKRFMGFGYGIMVTPLQVACGFSAIANKGVLMRPHLVKKIIGNNEEEVIEIKPQKIRKVISEKTCSTMTKMLIGVVEYGTGSQTKINGIKIAGKTGTTKQVVNGAYSSEFYTASFAGYFPAENPKVALIITLDKPKGDYYGGSTAAPIFREIAVRMMASSSEYAQVKTLATIQLQDSALTPNVRGMFITDAENILKGYGFRVKKMADSGIVLYQSPAPGVPTVIGKEISIGSNVNQQFTDTTSQKKPTVVGLSLRRAISILHANNIKTTVSGSGKVRRQEWTRAKNGEIWCKLICD